MLVGDLIVGCRELIPDLPQVIPPPANIVLSVVAGTPVFGSGVYFLKFTAVNNWGETTPSAELTITLPNLAVFINAAVPIYPGTTFINCYITIANGVAGGENWYIPIPITPANWNTVLNIDVNPIGSNVPSPGFPPTRNTAFLPDSNGRFASVGTLYRWLNEALLAASSIAEGLPNTSGIPAVAGQGQYNVPGQWKKFWNGWFNGIPFAWGGSKDMFYRNVLSGYTFLGIVQKLADTIIFELQPQPNHTGGVTTLSSPLNVGDTSISLTSTAGIILPLGVAQIGSEIVVYSNVSSNQLAGCSRGMGGTIEANWPVGTVVKECNIRFNGQILFTNRFTVGQALNNVPVPADWYIPLRDYMLNLAKQGEKSAAEYQAKLKEFSAFVKMSCKGNQQPAGPRQVGGTSYPGDSYPSRGGFGIIVP